MGRGQEIDCRGVQELDSRGFPETIKIIHYFSGAYKKDESLRKLQFDKSKLGHSLDLCKATDENCSSNIKSKLDKVSKKIIAGKEVTEQIEVDFLKKGADENGFVTYQYFSDLLKKKPKLDKKTAREVKSDKSYIRPLLEKKLKDGCGSGQFIQLIDGSIWIVGSLAGPCTQEKKEPPPSQDAHPQSP